MSRRLIVVSVKSTVFRRVLLRKQEVRNVAIESVAHKLGCGKNLFDRGEEHKSNVGSDFAVRGGASMSDAQRSQPGH